jgi:hypothetical protein
MVTLRRDDKGNYIARKRLSADVRDEYGRLYGAHYEAKFFRPKSTKHHEATKDYGAWLAETEYRVEEIRATRDGAGLSLRPNRTRRSRSTGQMKGKKPRYCPSAAAVGNLGA